ncbi:hypothetical protein JCM4814A_40300 [Streptomyces phaeofaciens JCM 4814]|uniref:Uncharacterized protein n=1 Tax=Streptomyces phaeofaciens TaxID=68254 RepID=A0A918HDC7_9ACTN|nr:hypothetical protein GCM10010226_32090 [Streptomyces phaeofaciens]
MLRRWIPRRRTARPMPRGVFLSLAAAGMVADGASDVFVTGCFSAVLTGTGHRLNPPQDAQN